MVPESVMPKYAYLKNIEIDGKYAADMLQANLVVGVPYTKDEIANARADFMAQADPDAAIRPG